MIWFDMIYFMIMDYVFYVIFIDKMIIDVNMISGVLIVLLFDICVEVDVII